MQFDCGRSALANGDDVTIIRGRSRREASRAERRGQRAEPSAARRSERDPPKCPLPLCVDGRRGDAQAALTCVASPQGRSVAEPAGARGPSVARPDGGLIVSGSKFGKLLTAAIATAAAYGGTFTGFTPAILSGGYSVEPRFRLGRTIFVSVVL